MGAITYDSKVWKLESITKILRGLKHPLHPAIEVLVYDNDVILKQFVFCICHLFLQNKLCSNAKLDAHTPPFFHLATVNCFIIWVPLFTIFRKEMDYQFHTIMMLHRKFLMFEFLPYQYVNRRKKCYQFFQDQMINQIRLFL